MKCGQFFGLGKRGETFPSSLVGGVPNAAQRLDIYLTQDGPAPPANEETF